MTSVMIFLPDMRIGGAERVVLNLLSHWPEKLRSRLVPTLVLRRYAGGLCDQVPHWVDVVSLDLPPAGLWSSVASIWRLGLLMSHRRPTAIVAFHTATFAPVVLASRVGCPGTKTVVSVNERPSTVWGGNLFQRLVFKLAIILTGHFLTVTPANAQELRSSFGVPKRKITTLHNSVDIDKVLASQNAPTNHYAFERRDLPIVITAGRLTPRKRYDVLLRAASLLAAKIKFTLAIIGDGELREDLERLASTLGIADRTLFLGFVPNPWSYISKASVFALSSDNEGFGNVLVEAMACGVPVVATRAPYGPEYIISNEENGLLVPVRDPEALANAVRRLLVDQELRKRCIEAGFKRASDFRAETVAQSFCAALENIINEESCPS